MEMMKALRLVDIKAEKKEVTKAGMMGQMLAKMLVERKAVYLGSKKVGKKVSMTG